MFKFQRTLKLKNIFATSSNHDVVASLLQISEDCCKFICLHYNQCQISIDMWEKFCLQRLMKILLLLIRVMQDANVNNRKICG